jgi:hypothetical protein
MNYIESQWTKKTIIDVNLKHNANTQSMNIKRSQNKMTKLDISQHILCHSSIILTFTQDGQPLTDLIYYFIYVF